MLLLSIISATIIVSLISVIAVFSIYWRRRNIALPSIIALAAGALLTVSFLDLLPEAIEESHVNTQSIFATVLVSLLIFFIIERYWHWHHCRCSQEGDYCPPSKTSIAYTNLIGDGLHNFIDGALIASAFMLDTTIGILATIAVIFHEIPQEISDFGVLLYSGFSRKKALVYNFLFALTAVLGAGIFFFFGKTFSSLIPFMSAFAAGNFIYLATADLIPELYHEKNPKNILWHTFWLIAGVMIMVSIKAFLPDHHF